MMVVPGVAACVACSSASTLETWITLPAGAGSGGTIGNQSFRTLKDEPAMVEPRGSATGSCAMTPRQELIRKIKTESDLLDDIANLPAYSRTITIHPTPNRSVSMPKQGDQKVFC